MSRRKGIGRLWKTVGNFVLAAGLVVPIWGHYRYPMPTPELEFRQMEEQNLLPQPTELQAVMDIDGKTWIAGVGTDQVLLYQEGNYKLRWYRRQAGGTLIIQLEDVPGLLSPDDGGEPYEPWMLAVGGPENAVSAQLTLGMKAQAYVSVTETESSVRYNRVLTAPDPQGRDLIDFDETYVVEGEYLDGGGFYFPLEPHYPDEGTELGCLERTLLEDLSHSQIMDWQMEAVFYDAAGQALGTAIQNDERLRIAQREQYGWG